MKRPIQLGLIGCGWMSRFYGQTLRSIADRCQLAWATDANFEKAEEFCAEFGGEPRRSHRDAPADAYVIATPHHLHFPIYMDLATAGARVLIEKPLALTVAECDQMIAARDKTGGMIMVGYCNRYRRAPQALRRALVDGTIGQPLTAEISQLGNQEKYVGGWLLKKATLGGGCFFSSAGHLLDLLFWFHGPFARIHLERARRRLPMEGEDVALALVRHENGVMATLQESWCCNGPRHWQTFRIYGETGMLEMTYNPRGLVPEWHTCLWDGRVVLRRDEQPEQVLFEQAAPFEVRGQLEHFLECIETGARPLTDAESAREIIRSVRTAEANAPL